MRSLRNIRWKYVLYTLFFFVGLAGVVMLMGLVKEKSRAQVCTDVQVMIEGEEAFIDQHDILERIEEAYGEILNVPLDLIPIHDLEENLRDLPYISDAEIFLDIDGVMKIKVKQREAVLRVVNQKNEEFYVDGKGMKMPVSLRYVPHVMIANGFIEEGIENHLDTVSSKTVKDLVTATRYIRDDELWSNQVVQLYVNENRDIELIPRVGEQVIILGDAENLDDKFFRVKAFYQQILPRVGSEAYKTVNVKYEGQIIGEREEDWFLDSLQMKLNAVSAN